MSEAEDLASLLEERKKKRSTTPDEERNRCPECKSVAIHRRTMKEAGDGPRDTDEPWYCNKCFADFDSPLQGKYASGGGE